MGSCSRIPTGADTPDSFSVATPFHSPALLQKETPTCQGVQCASSQLCQVAGGQARCVPVSPATCRAQGDPHYTTFDGRRYDMMGTCSYTMAELNSEDQTLPAFSVEAKNEHRGSRRVSYVGFVTVRAYSHSVSLARGEVGFVRVSIQSPQGLIPIGQKEEAKPGCQAPTQPFAVGRRGREVGPGSGVLGGRDLNIHGRTLNPFSPALVLVKALRIFRDVVREKVYANVVYNRKNT